ncbi:MAG: hypothetical protein H0T49_01665 [Chloroflexia bacterium]|nr:hypothetical protein [Chloroflexia bacterium]
MSIAQALQHVARGEQGDGQPPTPSPRRNHVAGARTRSDPTTPAALDAPVGIALRRGRCGLTPPRLAHDGKRATARGRAGIGPAPGDTQLTPIFDTKRAPQPGGAGRPRSLPAHLIAGKESASERCRIFFRRRASSAFPPAQRSARGERLPAGAQAHLRPGNLPPA